MFSLGCLHWKCGAWTPANNWCYILNKEFLSTNNVNGWTMVTLLRLTAIMLPEISLGWNFETLLIFGRLIIFSEIYDCWTKVTRVQFPEYSLVKCLRTVENLERTDVEKEIPIESQKGLTFIRTERVNNLLK